MTGLDRPAFARLYEDAADDLLVFFARRTLDPEVALDLWAETLAQAFAGRGRFRGEDPRAWLYGIAYRQLARYHRRGTAERRALLRLGLAQPAFAEDDHERLIELADLRAERERVARALGRLRPKLREAVGLRIVGELPYPELAARLGVSEPTARARVSRGLRELRRTAPPRPLTVEVTS